MRFTPRLLSVSALVMIFSLDAPPDDAMRPVRGLETSLSSSPASSIAHFMAMYAYAAASPMKRRTLRSICSLMSMLTLPETRLRRPISSKFSL